MTNWYKSTTAFFHSKMFNCLFPRLSALIIKLKEKFRSFGRMHAQRMDKRHRAGIVSKTTEVDGKKYDIADKNRSIKEILCETSMLPLLEKSVSQNETRLEEPSQSISNY